MADYMSRYNPNRSAEWNYGGDKWKLSRSKIDLFIECPRCFYIDNKLGTKRPSIPSFNLNIAVDTLLKKEFDQHRKDKTVHPLLKENSLNAIPLNHKDIDTWRDNFVGLTFSEPETGLTVSGAVDDIWENESGEVIVVDYKATSKEESITSLEDSAWSVQYKRQVGVYQWLLTQNGFKVSNTAYFVYCNAISEAPDFQNTLKFETTLIPTEGDTSWIMPTLHQIKECLTNEDYPQASKTCEYCQYREACGKKLQVIFKNKQK